MSIQVKTGNGLKRVSDMEVSGSGGASALSDLTDVNITSPSDGDMLIYNGTSDEWENVSLEVITDDFITLETGFSMLTSRIYKQGKHVFGDICIKKSTDFSSSASTAGTIKEEYRPVTAMVPLCILGGTDEWTSYATGYCYIAVAGSLIIANQVGGSNRRTAKIHIDYMTA